MEFTKEKKDFKSNKYSRPEDGTSMPKHVGVDA